LLGRGGRRERLTPTTAERQLAIRWKRPMMALPMAAKTEAMALQTTWRGRRQKGDGEGVST